MRRILVRSRSCSSSCPPQGSARRRRRTATAYIGKPIVEVGVLSEGRAVEDPAATALIETQVGEPLSMAAVRESITHLFGLGRFQDVRVDATDVPGGVRLRYDLIPLHSVQQVDFRPVVTSDGAPARPAKSLGLDEGLLRRTMTNRFGASPPVGRAPDVARTLEQLYQDHGYLRATVRPVAVERHDPDRTLLAFDIDPGPRAVVGAVQVEGTPAGKRDAFVKTIHAVSGKPYEPLALTDGTRRVTSRSCARAAATRPPPRTGPGRPKTPPRWT